MRLSGWGGYPARDAELIVPATISHWREAIRSGSTCIRGMGRAYGDSAIAARVAVTRRMDRFIDFDRQTGVITCDGGVTLRDLLRVTVPSGWCVRVTPGTSWVTVGGAIASDVHGKNHHTAGTFGQHVIRMGLLLGNGQMVEISSESHPDLFNATCGGMGLTGVILWAQLRLLRIRTGDILEARYRTESLEETCELFESRGSAEYSVAWVDALTRGRRLGRGVFSIGQHIDEGSLDFSPRILARVPATPSFSVLSQLSMRLFNEVYFHTAKSGSERTVPLTQFFYPLDAVDGWNRLYGDKGFLQYQFVIPVENGAAVMRSILELLSKRGHFAYLAVLKLFGEANNHWLSFPIRGYALALDFKWSDGLLPALAEVDKLVLAAGGKVYLAKDSCLDREVFRAMYPRWSEFEQLREKFGAIGVFRSDQSIRLGLA